MRLTSKLSTLVLLAERATARRLLERYVKKTDQQLL